MRKYKKFTYLFLFVLILLLTGILITNPLFKRKADFVSSPPQTITPSPTPTPKPLTFEEMQKLYGPCTRLPTLFYHHIQSEEYAKENNQKSLTVYTDIFRGQMQYLKDKGYNTASVKDLVNFFDSGIPISPKSILLTFDDGYEDNYLNAYPILKELNFKITVFLPTGLMDNPEYLTWGEVSEMDASGLAFFANHTWSHKNVSVSKEVDQKEISTADIQLSERGYNNPKVFAYPYGSESIIAKDILASMNYSLAFSTKGGNIMCKAKRLDLPRIRVGNTPLSSYGF